MPGAHGAAPAYTGTWEDAEGSLHTLAPSSITTPDGCVLELALVTLRRCAFRKGSIVCDGRLSNDGETLTWSDGRVWHRKADAKSAPAKPPAARKAKLTLEAALRLQKALYSGYVDKDFQRRLRELELEYGGATESPEFLAERSKLFLSVQHAILPRFGFEGSTKGVVQMLEESLRFNGNEQFEENRRELNRLLGMAPHAAEAEPVDRLLGFVSSADAAGAMVGQEVQDPPLEIPTLAGCLSFSTPPGTGSVRDSAASGFDRGSSRQTARAARHEDGGDGGGRGSLPRRRGGPKEGPMLRGRRRVSEADETSSDSSSSEGE